MTNKMNVAATLLQIAKIDNDPRSWDAYHKYMGPVREMTAGDDMPLTPEWEDTEWAERNHP